MIKVYCDGEPDNIVTVDNLKDQLPAMVKSDISGCILLVTTLDEMKAEAASFVIVPTLSSGLKVGAAAILNIASRDYTFHFGRVSLEASK